MFRLFLLFVTMSLLFPVSVLSAREEVKAAFIRDGHLWLLVNNEEKQLTHSGKIIDKPKWSEDSNYLLYQKSSQNGSNEQMEVVVYEIDTGKSITISKNGFSSAWTPNKDLVSFQSDEILNVSDLKRFYNVAAGVHGYTWMPNGSGFILSTAGQLKPDGWSGAVLFKKKLRENLKQAELFDDVDTLFTLPKEIGIAGKSIIAVFADHLHYSPSQKWISFIVSPTASWSMDSNMLCVLSSDGKTFKVLDEVVFEVGEPKWAPTTDRIAFIAGGGRIVLGFNNKDLKIQDIPASGTYTPEHYADLDFTWINDKNLVSSRIREKEWSNDFKKHPLPSLTLINLEVNEQKRITNPPAGFGDYHPQYVKTIDSIVWQRGSSITDTNRALWKSRIDDSDAKEWLKNVDAIVFYER